jgi:ATP-dependent helicase/nuclease subunit A
MSVSLASLPMSSQLTPREQQALASDPSYSVWVTASAGSGKTTVLVGRILRLLLPSPDLSREGVPAHRILAITYTRAAAAHMQNKVQERLSQWAVCDEATLRADLAQLINAEPSEDFVQAARRLFAKILEQAQGIQIHTIHAFCQSVLGRFPLEAKLTPGFQVMDDADAKRLLRSSIHSVLTQNNTPALQQAIQLLSPAIELDSLSTHISEILENQSQLDIWVKPTDTIETVTARLAQRFPPPRDWKVLIDVTAFRAMIRPLETDNKTNQAIAQNLAAALEDINRDSFFSHLCNAVLKQDNNPRALNGIAKKDIQIFDTLTQLQDICVSYLDEKNLQEQISATGALFYMAHICEKEYTQAKRQRAALDYDDLITKTHELLHATSISWIHYKLDQGIDHILVDEAQDTSPAQWDIILRLMDDFFTDSTAQRPYGPRSVFVVGDPKQSIYSFRGADPARFSQLRHILRDKITQAAANSSTITPWQEIDFTRSFRTVPLILDLVDRCFDGEPQRAALGLSQPLQHISHRSGDGGSIEILPPFLLPTPHSKKSDGWVITLRDAALDATTTSQSILLYARNIAARIDMMIRNPDIIPGLNRPVTAGDILILFETRTALTTAIIRALKEKNIPVSGIDRLTLTDHIAVQDILTALSFACLPHDDMALACLLKSPFIGWSEDQLFALAHKRAPGANLWSQIRHNHPDLTLWLEQLINWADTLTPYAFLEQLLNSRPAASLYKSGLHALLARLGHDALDPVHELLNTALAFESGDVRTCRRFLTQLRRGRVEIKRDMDDAREEVRIMTLHAAKGLEAPVVIIPDSITSKNTIKPPRLLWGGDHNPLPAPLWAVRSGDTCQVFRQSRHLEEEKLKAEKQRLLYVGLTRGRDILIIGGKQNEDPKPAACLHIAHSWYKQIEQAALIINPSAQDPESGSIKLTTPQKAVPKTQPVGITISQRPALPVWVDQKVSAETLVIKRLRPSQMGTTPHGLSPAMVLGQDRFLRGKITHKLFQLLPNYAPEHAESIATSFVHKYRHHLTDSVRDEIVRETLAVLRDPDFAPVFGPKSRAEVPISGRVSRDVVITGQIDRLVVLPNRILVVDFKTNRPSPASVAAIPDSYRAQLQAYVTLLQRIYPDKPIDAALLWTDTARLMPVIKGVNG